MGQWKMIRMNCTECAFEEVQRLRSQNLRAAKSSFVSQKSSYTSDTASISGSDTTSDSYSSSSTTSTLPKESILKKPFHNQTRYRDDNNTSYGSELISLQSISETSSTTDDDSQYRYPPRGGILRKPKYAHAKDESALSLSGSTVLSGLSESTDQQSAQSTTSSSSGESSGTSELTTEFSYYSGSSFSTASSDQYLPRTNSGGGILKRPSRGSSASKGSRQDEISRSSRSGSRSSGSRVSFAGRDMIINPVRFAH